MYRAAAVALLLAIPIQEGPDAAADKAKLHEDLAAAAEAVGEQLIKLKAWDEARAFLDIIRAKSDARAEALDKLISKTEKQTSGLKWDQKTSDLIRSYGQERSKPFLEFAKAWSDKEYEVARWTEAEGTVLLDLLDYVKAYARITSLRSTYDQPKPTFDWSLSVPAVWHARYLLHHPSDPQEIEGKAGFTAEGHKSGRNSISNHAESLNELVEAITHATFHRIYLLHPSLKRLGMGQAAGAATSSVLDIQSGLLSASADYVMQIPKHKSPDVPLTGYDDHTRLIPSQSMKDLGYPISLVFYNLKSKPQMIKAELRTAFKVVETYSSSPDNPALPKRYPSNKNAIVLIPRKPLSPHTTYTVVVEYSLNGSKTKVEWAFSTGR